MPSKATGSCLPLGKSVVHNVFDKKAMLKLEKEKNGYSINVIVKDEYCKKINKSKKLAKIWKDEALDLLMIIKYKEGDKIFKICTDKKPIVVNLETSNFDYLMNIPGFYNAINNYLKVLDK